MTFYNQNYPVTIQILCITDNWNCWLDEIKGLNAGHALWRARDNWPHAEIVLIIE